MATDRFTIAGWAWSPAGGRGLDGRPGEKRRSGGSGTVRSALLPLEPDRSSEYRLVSDLGQDFAWIFVATHIALSASS